MKANSDIIRKRYDRIAPVFDLLQAMMEGLFFRKWRRRLWEKVEGYHILEVGVGTGKNMPYYPNYAQITAIDFSQGMLQQAAKHLAQRQTPVHLEQMDVQALYFADNSFDTVVATFVFCSVPNPAKGLRELHRVLKPGGQLLLVEHVQSSKPWLAALMQRLNPLLLRLSGANINRNTVKTVQACPFLAVRVDERSGDLIKLIEARK